MTRRTNMTGYKNKWSVAELLEPYDAELDAWQRFLRSEREYEERQEGAGNDIQNQNGQTIQ